MTNVFRLIVVCGVCLSSIAFAQSFSAGVPALDASDINRPPCITPERYAAVEADIEQFLATRPDIVAAIASLPDRGAQPFAFFPQAGNLYEDLFVYNFVDLDPSPSVLDWNCRDISYDGHNGIDVSIRSFGEQVIGVPIYAALDGYVAATNDGAFDMQTTWSNAPANYVILTHANGLQTWYWHMKNGSVAVTPGEYVRSGQQLGLTASSGNSTGPHLHFEVRQSGAPVEPWSGPCQPGASMWRDQPPMRLDLYAKDFGVTQVNLHNAPPEQLLPFMVPRDGQIVKNGQRVYFWIVTNNLPANSTWTAVALRPNGTVGFNFGSGFIGGASHPFYRESWWWWWYTPIASHPEGTWTFRLTINGQIVAQIPYEVRNVYDDELNRPPTPFTVSFDPASPTPDDVLFCRVDHDLLLDDPDFDIVRYNYVWTVDGVEVRSVTNAALSDALPRNSAAQGQTVECTVTAYDDLQAMRGPEVSSFTMVEPGTPPGPFGLIEPPNNVYLYEPSLFLSIFCWWSFSAPNLSYTLIVANDALLLDAVYEVVLPQNTTSHVVPEGLLSLASQYWWGVVADNGGVQTPSTPVARTFYTHVPGDVDGDGKVDQTDLNYVLQQYGQSGMYLPGDINGNNLVDFADFTTVLVWFGTDVFNR